MVCFGAVYRYHGRFLFYARAKKNHWTRNSDRFDVVDNSGYKPRAHRINANTQEDFQNYRLAGKGNYDTVKHP